MWPLGSRATKKITFFSASLSTCISNKLYFVSHPSVSNICGSDVVGALPPGNPEFATAVIYLMKSGNSATLRNLKL